ncbi:hypothetical protein SEVIR_4G226250v4 [Setaria viridis]
MGERETKRKKGREQSGTAQGSPLTRLPPWKSSRRQLAPPGAFSLPRPLLRHAHTLGRSTAPPRPTGHAALLSSRAVRAVLARAVELGSSVSRPCRGTAAAAADVCRLNAATVMK